MDPPRTRPAPTDAGERLHTLDILRGLALFGMILVHFHQTMRLEVSGPEDLISWAVYALVEQKAWGTFAFLFGVGFAVLLRRLEARGSPVAVIYLRRLAALAAFGVVAQVFLGFHILFDYATWGLALLVLRHWPTRLLLATAAIVACARPIAYQFMLAGWWSPGGFLRTRPLRQAATAAAAQSDYGTLLDARWDLFVASLPHSWRDLFPDTNLALFILGLLAVRHGLLDAPRRHVRTIGGWMAFGAVAWSVSWFVLPRVPPPATLAGRLPLVGVAGFLQDQWLCFTYIGAVVLLVAFRPIWVTRLSVFGLAGRMALTNYMLQIVVLDVLGSAYGAGLRLRPSLYVLATVGLFGVEAILARIWLARFRWGPLEWIWRTITYARPQPLARDRAAIVPVG